MAENTNNTEQGSASSVPEPSQATAPQPQQPPMTQSTPPQQAAYQAPAPMPQPQAQPQPLYMPAPLMQLTGGMKFGWFVVGALLGVPGIVIAWLINVDKFPQVKSDALKWTIIGFAVWIALGILISILIGGMFAAMFAGAMGSMGYYDSGYHGSW